MRTGRSEHGRPGSSSITRPTSRCCSRAISASATRSSAGRSSARIPYAGGATDFSHQIAWILALPTPPDMLYVSSGPDDIGRLVKQLSDAGGRQPIVGGDGYDTPLLLQGSGRRRR